MSDEEALELVLIEHNYTSSFIDTAAACVKAGCNLELSGTGPAVYGTIGMYKLHSV